MAPPNRTPERLVALFVLGVVLMVPPMVEVFNRPVRVLGIPVLYLYVFVAWGALIVLVAATVRTIAFDDDSASETDADASRDPSAVPKDR